MTTPTSPLEDRVTVLETRLDAVLLTLATKEDIARLDGKIDAVAERLNGKIVQLDAKIDAMANRLLIRLSAVAIAITSIAIAVVKYL